MKHPDLHHLLQRYQQGECTPEEQRLVEHWYSLLGHEQPPLTLTAAERQQLRAELWQRIEAQTLDGEDVSPPARSWRAGAWRWVAAAAVVLGVGAGAQHLLAPSVAALVTAPAAPATTQQASGWHSYHNTSVQTQTVRLSDGSTVQVSAGAQLKYPARFAARHRTVYLKGEAFFQIAPDKAHPFRVYTHEVVTTVLGTSFLVRAPEGPQPVVVKVRTGRVQVNPLGSAAGVAAVPSGVVVLPNQQAVYSPLRRKLQRELVAEPLQLAAQSFAFDDRPVTEVLATLEKAYGVDIDYDASALAGCTVTLNLPDESLYSKLDVLCKTLGASYTTSETHIVFRSPGCAAR
ncbi:FecR domain-containing protein [Hymenobacter sp. HSC-4F20]|uniref:FecR family protein n=1 Tax=Hymenobacter sp. HSC-4F20 TaxID=2864135 RepID=UPI001C732565|nr:FecR domain-containing protein [Hymenobacter sp. HSC-4F20]MBX0289248.1 FecR domain-containing protein [Hymenobacter sp. HSC-4F20]